MSGRSATSSATGTGPASSPELGGWGRALAFVQGGLTVAELSGAPVSKEDADAFSERSRERAVRSAAGLSLLTAVCALAWWPFDPWIYTPAGVSLVPPAVWRVVLTVVPAVVAALLGTRRAGLGVFATGLGACCVALGCTAGWMGGVSTPWFHILNVTFFIPVVLPVPMRTRLGLTLLVAAALWVGLFLGAPQDIASGYIPLAVAVQANMMLLSVLFGNGLYLLNRQAFLQGRTITRDAEQLAAYSTALEGRVAARTAELRELLATVESAREAERARISHELHDELGQELTVLGYEAAVLQRRYASDPAGIADRIEDLTVQLERTRAALRSLVSDLRPRVIDDLGLVPAVEWLVTRAGERAEVEVALEVTGEADIVTGDVAVEAFRIVQEALTNVLKHAGPARAEVHIACDPGVVRVEVVDDGRGAAAPSTRPSTTSASSACANG